MKKPLEDQLGLFPTSPAPGKPRRAPARRGPAHTCHARGCGRAVKPELLMCLTHWRMVPRPIQLAVWRHYRPGQCDDKDVTPEWLLAADAAIGAVALREGRPLRDIEKDAYEKLTKVSDPSRLTIP